MPRPPSPSPHLSFLRRAAAIDQATLARWCAAGLVGPDARAGQAPALTRLDVMAAAILAEFARYGIGEEALEAISALIYGGAQVIARHAIAIGSIPAILYHGTLRLAEEDGRFAEVARANAVDPSARLFARYPDYLVWCRACGTAPGTAEEALLDVLEPDDLALLPYCYDLLNEETPPGWSVVWDLVMLEGTPLLYTRRSIDPPPLDIADGREAAAWLSLSVTAIDRQIATRLARSGSPS